MRKRIQILLLGAFIGAAPVIAQGPGAPAGPPPGPRGGMGPRAGGSLWESPWWAGRLSQDLNLSEAQKSEINAIVKDYRSKMMDARDSVVKADADVEDAFDENPVDQRKANEAIERLAAARADMTRTLSQMSLKLRAVLTADQWQELQRRRMQRFEGGERFPRGVRRQSPAPPSATKQ